MADKIKLQFAPGQPAAGNHPKTGEPLPPASSIEIGHGEYSRKFDAKDQPFECDAEEARLLLGTGVFVEATEKPAVSQEPEKTTPQEPEKTTPPQGKIGGAPATPGQ